MEISDVKNEIPLPDVIEDREKKGRQGERRYGILLLDFILISRQ